MHLTFELQSIKVSVAVVVITINYIKRLVDDELEFYLDVIRAVLIVGPKGCGKTTATEQHANSVLKL